MRRTARSLVLALLVVFTACIDDAPRDPVGPPVTDTQLGKKGPTGCLSPVQKTLSDEIQDEIGDLFANGGSRNAATQQLNNIDRKLCDGDYADALDKAFGYLGLINEKFPDQFDGSPADAAAHISKVFSLVAAAPNPNPEPFEIPEGAFDPETGGIITFDPDNVTLPFVATTGNNEAAVVLDVPGVFPPGTGPVTIVLARAPGGLVTTFGAFIPGFQAYEEGYEIISSHQPWDEGPGILVALCAVPPLPSDAAIGHLHEGEVSLLVPTDPDPQALGYIDCSDVNPTFGGGPVLAGLGDSGLAKLARRALEPVVEFLSPSSLHAEALVVGPGLGGRTKSLSLDAPVDPVIGAGETVELQSGYDATWTSEDEDIATVEGFGDSAIVTGVCPGTTYINASLGEEELLSIRITVVGEGECSDGFPAPILAQTDFTLFEVGVEWELSITNADDYDAGLFTTGAGEYGACAASEGDASRLTLLIYDAGGEVPTEITNAFLCDITSASDLSTFYFYDEYGDVSQIYVELVDNETEEVVMSNTISLVIPVTF